MGGERERFVDDVAPDWMGFLEAGLVVGVVTFVLHALLLPPGWLWFDVAWVIVGLSGVLATIPGYLRTGPVSGIVGTSAPGLGLALRGEIVNFYPGCYDNADLGRTCSTGSAGQSTYLLEALALSFGLVLVPATFGYAVGAGLRRLRARATAR